jgi:hypothetical protein
MFDWLYFIWTGLTLGQRWALGGFGTIVVVCFGFAFQAFGNSLRKRTEALKDQPEMRLKLLPATAQMQLCAILISNSRNIKITEVSIRRGRRSLRICPAVWNGDPLVAPIPNATLEGRTFVPNLDIRASSDAQKWRTMYLFVRDVNQPPTSRSFVITLHMRAGRYWKAKFRTALSQNGTPSLQPEKIWMPWFQR